MDAVRARRRGLVRPLATPTPRVVKLEKRASPHESRWVKSPDPESGLGRR